MPNALLKGKTFRTLMQITASDSGKLPEDIMVLPKGDWNTQFYGPMQVTADHLSQIVANFKAGVRKAVPIDVDHDGGRAAGWIKELRAEDDGLHATADWTPYGEGLLKNKEYKLFSPEWSFDYVDPEHGTRHGCVLIAGSLTNRPLFKELPVLTANDGSSKEKGLTNEKSIMILLGSDAKSQPTMKIEDILKKTAGERSKEEIEFLKAHEAELTAEQKKKLADEDSEAKAKKEKEEADAKAKAEAEAKAKADADAAKKKEEEEKQAAEKGNVTIKASELENYKKIEAEHIKAKEQLRRVATETEIKAFMANEKGGKILPKAFEDGKLVDMVMTFSEDQKKSFLAFVNALPDIKVAGEKGDGDTKPLTAKEKLDTLVIEALKKAGEEKRSLTKAQAIKEVLSANEALAKEYQKELSLKK